MPAPTNRPRIRRFGPQKRAASADTKLDELIERHRAHGNTLPQTIDPFAAVLVRESLLTFFQAKQLKLGRYKRFTIGSKYRLLELIGAGGMGAVYLCEHTLMKRLVALKVLPVEKLEDPSQPGAVSPGGAGRRGTRSPQYRTRLRHRSARETALPRDGIRGREQRCRTSSPATGRWTRSAPLITCRAVCGRPSARPRTRHGASRREARQPAPRTHRRHQSPRHGARPILQQAARQRDRKVRRQVRARHRGLPRARAGRQQFTVDIRADIYTAWAARFTTCSPGQTPYPDGTIAAKLVAHQTREPKPIEEYRQATCHRRYARSVTPS